MKVVDSRRFRYWLVAFVTGKPSAFKSFAVRTFTLLALLLMAAPARVTREIVPGAEGRVHDLKVSLRSTSWLWNRSWIPCKFQIGTFFDIGWLLSEESCDALRRRRFVSKHPLMRKCDLAQLRLSSIRAGVEAGSQEKVEHADREILGVVDSVFNAAAEWVATQPSAPIAERTQVNTVVSTTPNASFDNATTHSALFDFDDLCQQIGQRYFLVSGTFLGAVRDGAFVGHDHDIDLGVFEEDLLESLLPALEASGRFTVSRLDHVYLRESTEAGVRYIRMEKPVLVRVVHASGIAVDVFVHFREGELVWHGTREQRWDNRIFELLDYDFLNRKFNGPADFDLYLSENYGADWREPKTDFDVNLDTPNLSYVGSANGLVYWAWLVSRAVSEDNSTRVRAYLDKLNQWGILSMTSQTGNSG